MIMADVFSIVFTILGVLLALPAWWLVTRALVPTHLARVETKLTTRPIACFGIGAGVAFGVIVCLLVLGQAPAQLIKVLAFLAGCAAIGYGLAGAGALATFIGNRLPSKTDLDQPWRATLRGGIALELSFLIPLLGWFVLLPGSVILGVGAMTWAWFGAKAPKATHPEVAAPTATTPSATAGAGI